MKKNNKKRYKYLDKRGNTKKYDDIWGKNEENKIFFQLEAFFADSARLARNGKRNSLSYPLWFKNEAPFFAGPKSMACCVDALHEWLVY